MDIELGRHVIEREGALDVIVPGLAFISPWPTTLTGVG
jgi:hypothetical protein